MSDFHKKQDSKPFQSFLLKMFEQMLNIQL